MKKDENLPYIFNSISELHKALGLPKPFHPLLSLVNYADVTADVDAISKGMILNFYKVSFKKNFSGKIKYGQGYYDFDEGGMSFFSPGQVIKTLEGEADYSGCTLLFHPDFIRGYTLANTIKNYGYFSYSITEALFLADKERNIIVNIFNTIGEELSFSIDNFSQDIIVSQIEQLLNYCNRYYTRQFITRKVVNNDLLTKMDMLLSDYFAGDDALVSGIPSVGYLASKLNVSPRYLSDMLRVHTGQNAQQHIHDKLIDKAKDMLSGTSLSVAEVAYQLGFEHPQSFNKIFKKKTNITPLAFKQSLYKN